MSRSNARNETQQQDSVKPPDTPRSSAEQKLHDELDRIGWALFGKELDTLSAASQALRAVGQFLYDRDASGWGMKPLAVLAEAIKDVQRGISPEIFDPNWRDADGNIRRSRSRSSAKREVKSFAAALMDALMKSGMSKQETARRVARAARNWPRVDAQIIEERTVTGWRDELMQAMPSDPDRQDFERRVGDMTEEPHGKDYREFVLRNGPPMLAPPQRENTEPTG